MAENGLSADKITRVITNGVERDERTTLAGVQRVSEYSEMIIKNTTALSKYSCAHFGNTLLSILAYFQLIAYRPRLLKAFMHIIDNNERVQVWNLILLKFIYLMFVSNSKIVRLFI